MYTIRKGTRNVSTQKWDINYFTITFKVILFKLKRGSYTCTQILLNLLNELTKRDEMRGLPFYLFFRNEFNKFNNTGARMLDSITSFKEIKLKKK